MRPRPFRWSLATAFGWTLGQWLATAAIVAAVIGATIALDNASRKHNTMNDPQQNRPGAGDARSWATDPTARTLQAWRAFGDAAADLAMKVQAGHGAPRRLVTEAHKLLEQHRRLSLYAPSGNTETQLAAAEPPREPQHGRAKP